MPRLKELIQALGMSQVEFAKNLGIAKSTVSDVINGRLKDLPNPVQLKLYREYNVNLNWLLTGEGGMFLGDAGGSTTLTNRDLNSDRTGSANTGKPVIYDGDTFIDEDGNITDGKKAAKAAYQAYLDRKNNSTPKPAAKDVISLEGLSDKQKKMVIDLVNSYKDEK